MEGTVQNMSKEIIKPSSSTSHHLINIKLSYLDQLQPRICLPIIFFYHADQSSGLTTSNHSQISQHLKQSLSDTLTLFYPLAATVKDGSQKVDCNDAGTEFIEAQVDAHLVDVIQDPSMKDLYQYAFPDPTDGKPGTPLAVKVTFFKCGGISIAVGISHLLADAESILAFTSTWAATFRGQPDFSPYIFDAANYFPTKDFPDHLQRRSFDVSDEDFVTQRFIFNKETLMVLKREATSLLLTNPTKVEAVSAFIWMHFNEMAKSKTKSKAAAASRRLPAVQIVTLQGRMKPTLSVEKVFGNCFIGASALHNGNDSVVRNRYHQLVSMLRTSAEKIDMDYIIKVKGVDNYLNELRHFLGSLAKGGSTGLCTFSSVCGLPLYGVDFGWGNPTWVCMAAVPVANSTLLMKTKCGKGIEAWVTLEKDEVEILDAKIRLISSNAKRVGLARL